MCVCVYVCVLVFVCVCVCNGTTDPIEDIFMSVHAQTIHVVTHMYMVVHVEGVTMSETGY